jgi:hypothetical protein
MNDVIANNNVWILSVAGALITFLLSIIATSLAILLNKVDRLACTLLKMEGQISAEIPAIKQRLDNLERLHYKD